MTFSKTVKDEISKVNLQGAEALSELSAIVRNNNYSLKKIEIVTENICLARKVYSLFKEIYGIIPAVSSRKGFNYNKKYIHVISVNEKVEAILNDLSIYDEKEPINIPTTYIVADEDLIRAYIMGTFLTCGSINDPKKSRYHLELIANNEEYAYFLSDLLNAFELNAKVIKKDNKYMVYLKEAEKIGDFLRIVRTSDAVLYYEDIRIYRDHKNMTNRLNNCEQANVDKIIMTAANQVKAIEKIISLGSLDLLMGKEQLVASYRLKYNESSLQELSEIMSIETGKKITKSGVYHRMHKILLLANKIK